MAIRDKTCQSCGPGARFLIALGVLALLLPTGCVRRRLTVRSNPQGALVYVDNQQIGTTPCSVDFTYYGTREIRLVKPGFETLTVNQPIPTPWYEIPPLDFVSENLIPTKIRDNRTVMFNLSPQLVVPAQQLLDRANELRQDSRQGAVLPVSGTFPPGTGPPLVLPENSPVPISPGLFSPPTTFSTPPSPASPVLVPQRGRPLISPPLR